MRRAWRAAMPLPRLALALACALAAVQGARAEGGGEARTDVAGLASPASRSDGRDWSTYSGGFEPGGGGSVGHSRHRDDVE